MNNHTFYMFLRSFSFPFMFIFASWHLDNLRAKVFGDKKKKINGRNGKKRSTLRFMKLMQLNWAWIQAQQDSSLRTIPL